MKPSQHSKKERSRRTSTLLCDGERKHERNETHLSMNTFAQARGWEQSKQNRKPPSLLWTGTVAGSAYKQRSFFLVCVDEGGQKLKVRGRNSCFHSTLHDAILLSSPSSSGGHLSTTRSEGNIRSGFTPQPTLTTPQGLQSVLQHLFKYHQCFGLFFFPLLKYK